MAGKLSISATDLRRLRALTDPSQLDQSADPLPQSLLQGLADLVGCDNVVYESHDLPAQVVIHHQRLVKPDGTEDFSNEAVQNSFWDLYHRGLCDYWLRTGDYTSVRQMLIEPRWHDPMICRCSRPTTRRTAAHPLGVRRLAWTTVYV
jgi:hypothetical protein